jgi:hypothetical protein
MAQFVGERGLKEARDEQMSLIYSMHVSVDGYVEDEHGRFGFTAHDEEVNPYINQLTSSVGTYLYGRRMYEAMVYLGDCAHGSQPAPVFARLDAAMAGNREDRLLQNPRRAAQRANSDQARVRSRRRAAAQERRPPRHHR